MTIKVQHCHNGHFTYFRLCIPHAGSCWHENVRGNQWDRKTAHEALDICEKVYGLKRKNIRFKS